MNFTGDKKKDEIIKIYERQRNQINHQFKKGKIKQAEKERRPIGCGLAGFV